MNSFERAMAYLNRLPPAVAGSGGHNTTLRAACECFRFGLSTGDTLQAMRAFNARCQPPWSEKELAHKVADAERVVRGAGELGKRGQRASGRRAQRAFVAPQPPTRRVRTPVDRRPVAHRSAAEEDSWWAGVAAALGMTLEEFDSKCGVIK